MTAPNFDASGVYLDSGEPSNNDSPYQIKVPVIEDCSYDFFHRAHLIPNSPCIFRSAGSKWNASKLWCKDGKPDFEYLKEKYGGSIITVHHCKEKYFDSHTTSKMKFSEYIDYWKKYNETENKADKRLLYLKDWHMKNEYKDDNFYEVPSIFSSDWLNEYLVVNLKDDYRFVYMGPAGSWTPFHKDVLGSYSWSVNVCGCKKWILFPPGEEKKLMNGPQLPFTIKQVPPSVLYAEVIQQPGDALFVPAGWHHIVWNLKDTISINHNWANGANITHVNFCIHQGLVEVQAEMRNLSNDFNFPIICQDVLRQHVGMNHEDFFELIRFITNRRLEKYLSRREKKFNLLVTNDWVLYDLHKCREILTYNLKPFLCPETRSKARKLLLEIVLNVPQ